MFIAQHVKIDLIIQNVQLNNCQNFIASINTIIKKNSNFKRTIRIKQVVNVSITFIVIMSINYYNNLLNDESKFFIRITIRLVTTFEHKR